MKIHGAYRLQKCDFYLSFRHSQNVIFGSLSHFGLRAVQYSRPK